MRLLPHRICYSSWMTSTRDGEAYDDGNDAAVGGNGWRPVSGSAASAQRRILEEFVALRGYHRTHALRVPNGSGGHVSLPRGPAPRRRQNRGRALVPPGIEYGLGNLTRFVGFPSSHLVRSV